MRDNFGKILLCFLIGAFASLWLSISFKAALFAFSSFCLLMWVNVTLTTLANAFIGRDIDVEYDIFWKILFILLSSVGFGVYFNI